MKRNGLTRQSLAFASALIFALPSLVRVAELSASEFADAEVATNVSVDTQGLTLMIIIR